MDQGISEEEFRRLTYKGELPDFFTDPNCYENLPINEPSGEFNVPLVLRDVWGALPPTTEAPPLRGPVAHVRLVTTNTNKVVYPHAIQALQVYQKFHMIIQGLPDIPYNFLVDQDGNVYEGAGWRAEVPKTESELQHLKGNCLDIGLIGDFRNNDPPERMILGTFEFIKYGIFKQYIKPNFEIIPFRNVSFRIPASSDET